jgi:glutaredoxin
MKVTVYSRPECHLCDEALERIHDIAREEGSIEVDVVDIELDDDLMKKYLERIPVVLVGSEVISELVFDPATLRGRLGIA